MYSVLWRKASQQKRQLLRWDGLRRGIRAAAGPGIYGACRQWGRMGSVRPTEPLHKWVCVAASTAS